jgi:hypothetical protein
VSSDFWTHHEKQKQEVQAFLRCSYESYPDDLKLNIDERLRRWSRRGEEPTLPISSTCPAVSPESNKCD